ncbi:hypothetical protein MLD38_021547 [Melastoma candidum]|uniref:Uncharacterized protein n=1 Tax=Melastoma candidum TaxID=119954 RepID=A0ACB9QGF3_9MYRT|nr:hypothetical protein MLD38_021547 [Melastoma candidum]
MFPSLFIPEGCSKQLPRHKDCSSPPHGGCLLASSQSRDPSATFGFVFCWSWEKPQVEGDLPLGGERLSPRALIRHCSHHCLVKTEGSTLD